MTSRSLARLFFSTLLAVALVPSLASAQATLAGTVRDASGGVLPGVTVEASSPALIEKARAAVTDGSGQYQIVDLRPGAYSLTFTLPGFASVKRDDVEVTGGGVISINAEMRVGAVEETIIVTGETPVVDVQTSTRRQQVLSNDTIQSLPASRGYGNYIAAVPGIQSTGLGSSAGINSATFTARGGRSGEGTIQMDGMNVGSSVGGGGTSSYSYDMNTAAEVQVTISGGLAEVERGGPAFNIIPRSGGNTFRGSYFVNYAGEWSQGSNIDEELRALGFSGTTALIKSWDTNIALDGPILKDRLWFFGNVRSVGTYQDQPRIFANANAGNPNEWLYREDRSIKVRSAASNRLTGGRVTWQATPRNKVGYYFDYTQKCTGSSYTTDNGQCREPGDGWTAAGPGIGPGTTTNSPESGTIWDDRQKITQATYNSPVSNRILVDGGWSSFWSRWGDIRPAGALTSFIPVTEQSTAAGVPNSNFVYRGWPAAGSVDQQHMMWRAALSYVTGTHNVKFGYGGGLLRNRTTTLVGSQISYRFNNGVPNQLTQRMGPSRTSNSVRYDAFYAQDQWTRGRLTVQGGVRYEYAYSWAPDGDNGILEDNQFSRAFRFPRSDGVRGFHDITPRMGGAYDLFGNGKTALKVSLSKYLESASVGGVYTMNNPGGTLQTTTTRAWADADRDFVADCDFMNPAANGECQGWANLNWGNTLQTTTVNPEVLEGWGKRNWDWQFNVGIQHEVAPRVSVEMSYNRRWWGNFFVTHNRALDASDYDEVTLIAPSDPDLPGGGRYPVTFLTRNANKAVGVTDNYYTTTEDFGDEIHYWHGVDVTVNARLRNGLLVQGGTTTGRGVGNTCEVDSGRFGRPMRPVQVIGPTTFAALGLLGADRSPACDFTEPWLTTFRGLTTYTVPKIDVLVSAIIRLQPNAQPGADVGTNGGSRDANLQLTAAQFLAFTGRPLRAGVASESVNLLEKGALYGERVNNFDMRFAKIFRFGRTRTNVGVDLYNIFNSNTPTTFEATYDPANPTRWFQPTAVVQPRFVRFNVQFDF